MIAKITCSTVLVAGMLLVGSDDSIAAPMCCLKKADCCSIERPCCSGAASFEAGSLAHSGQKSTVENPAGKPICCMKRAYCCKVQRSCCRTSTQPELQAMGV